MGWFSSKEKKEQKKKLKAEENELLLLNLNNEFSEFVNYYCKEGDLIFIFKGFELFKGEIHICFKDKDTLPGFYNRFPFWVWELRFGYSSIKNSRTKFLLYKEELKKIGLKLTLENN